MKFSEGDKIALKSTAEEGEFVRVVDKKMVLIRINGTEFPVFASDIEHPYYNWFTDKKKSFLASSPKVYIDNIAAEKNKTANMGSLGMHLVFLPVYKNIVDDDIIEKVKVYLSNNQSKSYSFHYNFESKDGETFSINSEVNAYSDFYIHDISYEHLATNPLFALNCAEIISNITSSVFQFQEKFSIKPKKIFEAIQNMHANNNAFFLHYLFNTHPQEQTQIPLSTVKAWQAPVAKIVANPKPKQSEKEIVPVPAVVPDKIIAPKHFETENPFEIDLHIEKLYKNHEILSASEKINFQMAAFTKALDNAILSGQQSLIVIHGVGKGVLKLKIHAMLNQTKQVHSYVNQFDNRFGFGATEIFF
jgi:hypothetical protein